MRIKTKALVSLHSRYIFTIFWSPSILLPAYHDSPSSLPSVLFLMSWVGIILWGWKLGLRRLHFLMPRMPIGRSVGVSRVVSRSRVFCVRSLVSGSGSISHFDTLPSTHISNAAGAEVQRALVGVEYRILLPCVVAAEFCVFCVCCMSRHGLIQAPDSRIVLPELQFLIVITSGCCV